MSVDQHKKLAPRSASCAVITVSDSRTVDSDGSGAALKNGLEGEGHVIAAYQIVADDADRVATLIKTLAADPSIDAIITNGGTGIAPRDNTYEAVAAVLTRRIDGFGELFRALSYEDIGSAAMLSRAVGGLVGATAVFALPGSTAACSLALERLILPELGHVIGLANPDKWKRVTSR